MTVRTIRMKTTFTVTLFLSEGNHYVYSVLDWGDKPGNAVLTVFIAVVSLPLIYSVFWLLTIIRNKLHIKLHQKEGQNNLGFSGEV